MSDHCTIRLVRPGELAERLSVSRTTLWRWERSGRLPKRRRLGENVNVTGWSAQELEEWFASTKDAADGDLDDGGPEE
ncbi:MAG: helix-turn-helix transcriptional regulator [Actinomycetota bacterium]